MLEQKGYSILVRNWRYKNDEIDIVAQIAGILIFVEVKTRSTSVFGSPEEAVGLAKQKKLVRAANFYIDEHDFIGEIRFDIVAIVLNDQEKDILHFEDAFFPKF
ncbi:UNVERIFIED_CONTAM: hypothetical protein GTU68_021617 [Idotea baltica]|nr:hypothetical protein [Idotea baltica]